MGPWGCEPCGTAPPVPQGLEKVARRGRWVGGSGWGWRPGVGTGNWEENERNDSNPRNSFIYSGVRAHMSADLRVRISKFQTH